MAFSFPTFVLILFFLTVSSLVNEAVLTLVSEYTSQPLEQLIRLSLLE